MQIRNCEAIIVTLPNFGRVFEIMSSNWRISNLLMFKDLYRSIITVISSSEKYLTSDKIFWLPIVDANRYRPVCHQINTKFVYLNADFIEWLYQIFTTFIELMGLLLLIPTLISPRENRVFKTMLPIVSLCERKSSL